MEFTKIVDIARDLAQEKLERRLPDSEVAAIQCMWLSIEYKEFSENHEQFMSQYRECYKSTTKPKAAPTLASGASRMMKLFASHYNLDPLTRTNFRRKITEACEQGIIEVKEEPLLGNQLLSEDEQFFGRRRELQLLRQSVNQKNVIAVWGNPGIGKSALLRHFCEHYLLGQSHLYVKYSDFNSLEGLLGFIYQNYADEETYPENIVPYIVDFFEERDFQLIIDFDYEVDHKVGEFLENISYQKLSENSCIICLSRKQSLSSYDFEQKSTLSLHLEALDDVSDYYPYLRSLGLNDKHLWDEIVSQYEGNFRELRYVSKFIREIFGGSISTYFSLGSLVVSPGVKDYFESIQFTEIDFEIFDLFKEDNTCISINFFKFLKGNISTAQIFNRILFLENHGFLLSRHQEGQMKFSLSPLLRAFLMEEGRIAA